MKKNKKNFKKLLCIGLSLFFLAACGRIEDESSSSKTDELIEVTIPSFKGGQNVGAKLFKGQLDRFNKKYEGKYHLSIEEVPQDAYGEKLKQLAQQDDLPVIVHAAGSGTVDNQWFEQVILENNMYHDLSEFVESNPEVEELLIEESIEFNTNENGELVAMPQHVVSPLIMYYNEKLYNPEKPIRNMTMEEFSNSLEDNKIAFMTGENAWTTGLFWTALIANQEGGIEFLQNQNAGKFTDLEEEIIIDSIKDLYDFIKKHGSSNTLGAIYADAANSFMSTNSALISNGPWMVADFAEGQEDKWSNGFKGTDVRGDYFPGNVGLQSFQSYGDWISATSSDEEIELAEAWFAFIRTPEEIETALIAEGGQAPNYEPSSEFMEELKDNPVLQDIQKATTDDTVYVPNILDLLPASVGDNELSKYLPLLLNEELTAEEFATELSNKAKQAIE